MKFMKLGSRPDTFYTSDSVRSVASEVSSDLTIQVKGTRYLLHKFPLLSKCLRLQKLCAESPETSKVQTIQLHDFPGSDGAFELCAKFCYGITITISAQNFVSIRCAAEYLQMTEEVDRGNLIYKMEVFFTSCILHGWKDSIVTLQTTKALSVWSEDLGIAARCINAIASKVSAHPAKVSLSRSYSSRGRGDSLCNGSENHSRQMTKGSKGWWAEDLAELATDLYWRTMVVIKSSAKVSSDLIGDALRVYASRWLSNAAIHLNSCEEAKSNNGVDSPEDATSKYRRLLESIISLLPTEKGEVACSFLLKLLKAANLLNASSSLKAELATRIGLQLDEASVSDLLIPRCISPSTDNTIYDVDIVLTILNQFVSQGQSPRSSPGRIKSELHRTRSRSAENVDVMLQESRRSSSASHGSKIKVAKIIDRYLQKIAEDKNLTLSKFIAFVDAIPEFARLNHDDLYKAINIYLKVHPEFDKSERKRICRNLDCRKLSMEACAHAAQNEMLPLRLVVQVLFLEQSRAAISGTPVTELPSNIKAILAMHQNQNHSKKSICTNGSLPQEDELSTVSTINPRKSNLSTLKMRMEEEEQGEEINGELPMETTTAKTDKPFKVKSLSSTPTMWPKGVFSKLWSGI